MTKTRQECNRFSPQHLPVLCCTLLILMLTGGCGAGGALLHITSMEKSFPPGSIIATATGEPISFETLCWELARVQVVYLGERHNDPAHHANQLAILQALRDRLPALQVGMEMFDRTYQPVLDLWWQGQLSQEEFLRRTHWAANWRYDFALYAGILDFIRRSGTPLLALNIPFHIPPKIAVGGLDSLTPEDMAYLPRQVDLERADHRAYVSEVFKMHRIPGRENFEHFYAAQCVWEDAMAEAIARRIGSGPIAVIAGNGHIQGKFGIPLRAAERTGASFSTVVQLPAGGSAELSSADFIWVTPP